MKQIAIVLSSYNGEKYIGEQIQSIMDNECQDFTLYVCDDCSNDNTVSVVKEYIEKYPERIVLHENKENMGFVKNFLISAKRQEEPYIMFCDQDDVWCPDKIGKTLKAMKEQENLYPDLPIAVYSDAKIVDENLAEIAPSFHEQSRLDTNMVDLPHILMENKLIGCTIMFNRPIKNMIGYASPEIRLHDWWIALLAAAFGKIYYIPESLMLYRQHQKNVVGHQGKLTYIKNRMSHVDNVKKRLLQTENQALAFLEQYGGRMDRKDYKMVRIFANLHLMNYFRRRYLVLHYGFLKSGAIRNVGVLLLI